MRDSDTRGLTAPLAIRLVMACCFATDAVAQDWRPFAEAESESYSEPFSVYAALHDLDGRLRGGDEAFTHNEVALGVARGPWSIALLQRYDYHLRFLPDTAELAHAGENDLPADVDRSYAVGLDVNHLHARGLRIGYEFAVSSRLELGVELVYLQGRTLLVGGMNGDVFTDDRQGFGGAANVDYRYSEDLLLHRRVRAPGGRGYSLDLSAAWQITERLGLAIESADVVNAVYWRDAPYTQANLTSATVDLDEYGFINTTPLLSGSEGERDFKQTLPARTRVGATYRLTDKVTLALEFFNVDSINLARVGFSLAASPDTTWGVLFDATTRAWVVNAEHRWLRVSIGLENLDYQRSHYVQFAASMRFPVRKG